MEDLLGLKCEEELQLGLVWSVVGLRVTETTTKALVEAMAASFVAFFSLHLFFSCLSLAWLMPWIVSSAFHTTFIVFSQYDCHSTGEQWSKSKSNLRKNLLFLGALLGRHQSVTPPPKEHLASLVVSRCICTCRAVLCSERFTVSVTIEKYLMK